MAFLLSTVLIILCAHFLALRAELRSPIAYLLGVYVFSCANIVLSGLIAGAFGLLAIPHVHLMLELVFLTGSILLVRNTQKTHPQKPTFQPLAEAFNILKALLKSTPELLILFLVVGASLLFMLVLIWFLPPNSHDVLTTHLSRVGYWLQNGTYMPYVTHNTFGVIYPYNPALQIAWSVVMAGSDRFVEIFQWLAALACSLAVAGLSRVLGADKPSSLFKGLLFLTFPIVIMQSSTAQTDLVVAAMCVTGFYFLLSGFRSQAKGRLLVSAIAFALALGSKQLAFLVLPGIALALLLEIVRKRSSNLRLACWWVGVCAAAFLLFGSETYIVNQMTFGNPFGPSDFVSSSVQVDKTEKPLEMLTTNALRFTYGAIDPTGLPKPLNVYLVRAKMRVAKPVLNMLDLDLESSYYITEDHIFSYIHIPETTEDEAWFGAHGFVILTSAFLLGVAIVFRKKDRLCFILAATAGLYFLLVVAGRPGWDPYQGRYFITAAVILLPVVPITYKDGSFHMLGRYALIALSLLILVTTHLNNYSKPVSGKETIWTMDWENNITRQNRLYRPLLNAVRERIPLNTQLGIIFSPGTWDYPLFTENFTRTVTPIFPAEKILDEAWLREQGIEYILINIPQDPWQTLPKYLNYFYQVDDFRFLKVRPAATK